MRYTNIPVLNIFEVAFIEPKWLKVSFLKSNLFVFNPQNKSVKNTVISLKTPVKFKKLFIEKAEGTGVEPVRAYAHEFSRLAHYRPAHLPFLRRVPESNRRSSCFADSCVSTSPTRLKYFYILL